MGWEQNYQCRLPGRTTPAKELTPRTGWGLFVLFGLQCVLLGASDEMDPGKLWFAAIYVLFLLLWLRLVIQHGVAFHEPVICWTLALIGLCVFSRLVGAFTGIPAVDWVRDFFPLLNFSWVLLGPIAFPGRTNIWRAYLVFMSIELALTLIVTDHYLSLRQFSDEGLEWTDYLRATDAVVLFGAFMAAPMTGLPRTSYRVCFGLITAVFISAALLTGTRSHLAAIVAGLVFYFWLTKPRTGETPGTGRRAVLGYVFVGVLVFGAALSTGFLDSDRFFSRTEEMSTMEFGALTTRLDESLKAWEGFQKSPLLGQGLGYRMPIVLLRDDQWYDSDLYLIHNFYLYVLLKFGVVGIPVFYGFLCSLLRCAISTFRQAEQPFDRAFSSGLASLIVALLVESVTAPRFQDRSATALLSILMVCLLAMRREIALRQVPAGPAKTLSKPAPQANAFTSSGAPATSMS
jgi:hypothetical protein